MAAELDAVIADIPLLDGLAADDFSITPLAGHTNRNYRLKNPQHDWVLRIPRAATNGFINRNAEAYNQNLAFKLGLAPSPSWRSRSGITLTATIAGSRAITAADFASDEMFQIIIEPIRILHRSGCRFQGQTNLDELLTAHFSNLPAPQQAQFEPRRVQARRILKLIEAGDAQYVPSHNDLVLENLLLTTSRLHLIDWEYSAMSSPYWDLAILCNAANLDLEKSQQLLQIYGLDGVQLDESMLFDYRGLLQLLSDCWMATLAGV